VLRQAFQQEAAKRPNVAFVDTWAMFQSPSGGYADFIVDNDGEAKLMRQDDGFHLNLDGANKLARAIEAEVEKEITARGGRL
jgi:lysophospholipase L1-like esterase